MNILVFNCGSSSLTYKVFRAHGGDISVVLSGKAHRVGVKGAQPSFIEHVLNGEHEKKITPIDTHKKAASLVFDYIKEKGIAVDFIGHRFVHGGTYFKNSVLIDKNTLRKLESCAPLAPIHNPISLSVIYVSRKLLPAARQYVVFDSAFHSAIPPCAYTYAIPKNLIEKFAFRKFGFHGLSYSYVVQKAARFLDKPLKRLKIIACHLGTGGSSVAAIKGGSSIDTSMGYSPLTGLVMSTRSGDVDPMLTIYLMVAYGYRSEDISDILTKKSGILGLSGFSSDIRDIINLSHKNGNRRSLAFDMYIHRLKKYIGSYIVVLGGIDALIFTDDIGVNNGLVREKVCENMEWGGIVLDEALNRRAMSDRISVLNPKTAKVKILSIPTDEERVILSEGAGLAKKAGL